MGKDNNALCEYLDNNERFADLFNAQFFQGKQVVTPDELESISEKYIEKPVKTHHNQITTERIRDIQKRLKSGGILRVLAIESQTYVDYTMPWRCMNYDSLEYGKQIRDIKDRNMRNNKFSTSAERLCGFLKSDRIIPVYTICLYHGQEPWDGPRSLQDMMDFGEDSDQWRELFADYRFRLVCMNETTDLSYFHTELKLLFATLPLRKDTKKLKKMILETPAFRHLNKETMEIIAIMTNNNKVIEDINFYENEEGKYNMCEALEGLKEEGRIEGADLKLIEQICKKLQKSKSPETIAEELEEELTTILEICNAANLFAPDYDCKKIYAAWKPEKEED